MRKMFLLAAASLISLSQTHAIYDKTTVTLDDQSGLKGFLYGPSRENYKKNFTIRSSHIPYKIQAGTYYLEYMHEGDPLCDEDYVLFEAAKSYVVTIKKVNSRKCSITISLK